jgi:hypothetical protein
MNIDPNDGIWKSKVVSDYFSKKKMTEVKKGASEVVLDLDSVKWINREVNDNLSKQSVDEMKEVEKETNEILDPIYSSFFKY